MHNKLKKKQHQKKRCWSACTKTIAHLDVVLSCIISMVITNSLFFFHHLKCSSEIICCHTALETQVKRHKPCSDLKHCLVPMTRTLKLRMKSEEEGGGGGGGEATDKLCRNPQVKNDRNYMDQ